MSGCVQCWGGRDIYGEACEVCAPPFSVVWSSEQAPEGERDPDAMPYADYLWTPEWRQRRQMHLRMADFTCDRCRTRIRLYRALQVHHRTYDRLGCEEPLDLEVLCGSCHRKEHGIA